MKKVIFVFVICIMTSGIVVHAEPTRNAPLLIDGPERGKQERSWWETVDQWVSYFGAFMRGGL